MASVFETLNAVNVNGHTEQKNGLTYLSWAWAIAELEKRYPDFSYSIIKNENGLPYFYDPNTGYMVFTTVTIEGQTREMWLPVMYSNNYAMKSEPYVIKTKYKDIQVKAATMFDINKTIMRCLVKNIGVFGLGLYVYAGCDLPEEEMEEQKEEKPLSADNQKITPAMLSSLLKELERTGNDPDKLMEYYKIAKLEEMSCSAWKKCMETLKKKETK